MSPQEGAVSEESAEMTNNAPTQNPTATTPSRDLPDQEPGTYWSDSVRMRDGPIRYHDGKLVDETTVREIRVATLEPVLDDEPKDAFQQTARKWTSISQNAPIATVFEAGDTNAPYVAFDVGEISLQNALPDLSTTDRVELLADVAEALRLGRLYSHRHGYLSPDVVHITMSDGPPQASVSEWGLRRSVEAALNEGTPITPYSAPEQVRDNQLGESVDIYQLGALGCYVFTGQPPVADEAPALERAILEGNVRSVADDDRVPEDVARIIDTALSTEPDLRQNSVRAVEEAFKRAHD